MGKSVKLGQMPNAPAFSAYASVSQSISSGVFTKVNFGTEEYDTNNNFASSRFTPTVPGYYQISAGVDISSAMAGLTRALVVVYKNGGTHKALQDHASSGVQSMSGSCEVYLNGTTDYVEIYAYVVATSPTISAGAPYTWMQGALVRAA